MGWVRLLPMCSLELCRGGGNDGEGRDLCGLKMVLGRSVLGFFGVGCGVCG